MLWYSRMRQRTARNESSRSKPTELETLSRSSSAAPEGVGEERPQYLSETGQCAALTAHPNPNGQAVREAVTLRVTTTYARSSGGGRRHRTNPLFCIRGLRRRGGRLTGQTDRASRGRGLTPATLPTRTGPLLTRRAPAVPLWAGRLPSTLTSTGRSGRRGCISGSRHTGSGHTRRWVSNRGCRYHRGSRARHHSSTGDTSSRQHRPYSHIPLDYGPRQAEEQSDEVRERERGKRDGVTHNRWGGHHRRSRVAAIAGSNNSLLAIPATPSRLPTPLPWPRAVRRKGRAVTRPVTVTWPVVGPMWPRAVAPRARAHSAVPIAVRRLRPGASRPHRAEGERDMSQQERLRPRDHERSVEREHDSWDRSRDPRDRERAQRRSSRESRPHEGDKREERERSPVEPPISRESDQRSPPAETEESTREGVSEHKRLLWAL